MANKLNLQAVLKFSAVGIREAKRQLDSLYSSFRTMAGAIGVGFGLGGFISELKETATQLSVAKATLENTSKGLDEYAMNLKFCQQLAKDYKQEQIGIIEGFAKFHAAASGTNVELEDQKKIFEALTKAAAFYHLSGDRTNNMLIAVEQMMSKGKITAEELRRQLGNNLPGAFNMMARAAGMSMAEFESAMKKGQVGVETLIKFADELNKTTENIDLNSLQLSMNEMKNAWTNFTESSEIEKVLKRTYDLAAKFLNWSTKHIENVKNTLTTLATGVIGGKLLNAIIKLGKALRGISFTGWAGIAIGAITAIIGKFDLLDRKLFSIQKRMKKISDMSDGSAKLYEMEAQLKESQSFMSDPKNQRKYEISKRRTADEDIFEESVGSSYGDKRFIQLFEEHKKVVATFPQQIEELKKKIEEEPKIDPDTENVPFATAKSKTLKDYLEEYRDDTKKLNNQLNAGSKTAEEAVEEGNKLAKEAWENITAFDDFRGIISKLPPELQKVAEQVEYFFGVAKETENIKNSEKQEKADNKDKEKWNDFLNGISAGQSQFKARDTRQDYKKKDYEIIREEQEQWEQISEDLQDRVNKIKSEFDTTNVEIAEKLNELNNALETAKTHVTNLKDAADVAEWENDVKELSKVYFEGLGSGIKSIATSLDRVTTGWKTLKQTMEDEDASGWEKFIAALSEIIQLFDTLNSLYETFTTLQKAGELLTKAQNDEELKGLALKIGSKETENILTGEGLALTKAATIAEGEEAGAAITATSAKSGEAIADATKSGAKLPFPYNIAAIAAGVAAVVGALALVGSFANGGIVKSASKHGDKNLAAVNGGEMILNTGQQSRLWNMINNGSPNAISNGGKVEFEVRGDKLWGVLKNYEKVRRG